MSIENFSHILHGLLPAADKPPRLAVAVSGGGDSMALCLLVQEFIVQNGGEILALTVDHGLREGSAKEAQAVGAELALLGIPHKILSWQGEKPKTHVQEEARAARYSLLLHACRAAKIDALCIAHNLEDQIETFWMRLAHGSGLDGLAAMSPLRMTEGLRIIRPLLTVPRADLRDYCRQKGMDWIEDPSNENEKFLRVKLRKFEEMLVDEGLTPQRLMQTLQKLEEARVALQFVTATVFAATVRVQPEGYAVLSRSVFSGYPQDIRRRVLSRAITFVAPQRYPLGASLDDVLDALAQNNFTGCTLAGCELSLLGENILLTREAAAVIAAPLQAGMIWDGRFKVGGIEADESTRASYVLGLLGEAGLASLRKILKDSPQMAAKLEAYPAKLRKALPVVKNAENILCVPHLNWVSAQAEPWLKNLRLEHCGTALAD